MRIAKLPVCLLLLLLTACASSNRPLQLITSVDPVYPAAAKDRRIEGFVVVEYEVTVAGHVRNPRVIEAQPPGVFDAAAIVAVTQWTYNPVRVQGESVSAQKVRSRLEFAFGEPERYRNY